MSPAALESLYRQFAPLVHARARRVVGSDADDVVQDLFTRLLGASPRPDAMASFIYSTSSNLCIDRLRHRARRERPDWKAELSRMGTGAEAEARGVESILADKELCGRLLACAPRAVQEAALLYYFDEMTQEEVAEALRVSRKTVVERIARFGEHARKQVRAWTT